RSSPLCAPPSLLPDLGRVRAISSFGLRLVRAVLDADGGELAEVAAEVSVAGRRALPVVLAAPELDLALGRPHRPRRSAVAVERHPDAAGVDEVGAVRAWPPELEVAVAEDDRPLTDALEQPLVVLARLRGEALVVRE